MLDKFLNFCDKFFNNLMIVFFLFLLIVGGYALYDSYQIYDSNKLDDAVIGLKPKAEEGFSFDGLREVNEDVEGWITMFETKIDYPVLHSRDNLEYLNMDYKREYALGGSIFIDYRNSDDFGDEYTVTYGHNMTTGQMYSDIKNYENSDYFNQHLYGALYTTDEMYKLEVMYMAKVNAYEDDIYNLVTYANGRSDELVKMISKRALKTNRVNKYDKLVLLSTCDSYGSNDRTVLLVAATKTQEEELDVIETSVRENIIQNGGSTVNGGGGFHKLIEFWWVVPAVAVLLVVLMIVKKVVVGKRGKSDKKGNGGGW